MGKGPAGINTIGAPSFPVISPVWPDGVSAAAPRKPTFQSIEQAQTTVSTENLVHMGHSSGTVKVN
jgi:hypothetical protein